jgi:O-antigen/teichoic acid export membrane protein
MDSLRERTIRGGVARVAAQGADFVLRIVSLMILARMLNPTDFGLLGMVTAFTGVLGLFRDFGLSAATVQRATITEEQTSTLFWINVLVGAALTAAAMLLAPFVGTFYHQKRVVMITVAVATAFLFNGAGVQHSALLQRQMRFTALAVIQVISLIISSAIGIGTAKAGYGYWALVAMTLSSPLVTTAASWIATGWFPGKPRRGVGIRSLMRFGGTLTLSGLVMYITFNLDKVLVGRIWGAEAMGIYGRACQLVRIPTDNLNSTVGEVAFSALSRVQHEPSRFKRYFLKGYSLVLAVTVPVTVAFALFADDIIHVVLGPKWRAAVPIFRFLAPTILALAIVNPLGWLLNALGLVGRGLKIALAFGPLMIAGYIIGLRAGPTGVAIAYSAVMSISVIPLIIWAVHGTSISFWDVGTVVIRPLSSAAVASGLALGVRFLYGPSLSPLPRLVFTTAVLFVVYFVALLFFGDHKSVFVDLIRGLKQPVKTEEKPVLSNPVNESPGAARSVETGTQHR